MIRFGVDRVRRFVDYAIVCMFCGSSAFALYVVWFSLDPLRIDLAGHMASGASFRRGLYHQLNDGFFLGYIHGLFYPPLEDAILAALDFLTGDRWLLAYQLYLTGLVVAYNTVLGRLSFAFEHRLIRVHFAIIAIYLLFMQKPGALGYQGMSYVDFLRTGMSTQILGGIGLFGLCRAWLKNAPRQALCFWLTFTILAHIVVSMGALALVACIASFEVINHRSFSAPSARLRDISLATLVALALSAFYWVPFLAHKSMLVSATIFHSKPWVIVGFAAVGALVLSARSRAWFLVGATFSAPLLIGPWLLAQHIHVPAFHYYRLAILGVWVTLIGWMVGGDDLLREASAWKRWAWTAITVSGAGAMCFIVGIFRYDLSVHAPPNGTLQGNNVPQLHDTSHGGRFFFIGDDRSMDFGVETYLSLEHPEYASNKGLYWESHRSNVVLTSYLGTLLAGPMVLPYFGFMGASCEQVACVADHFARDYNLRGWVVDEKFSQPFLNSDQKSCYASILNHGTTNFEFNKTGSFQINERSFSIFDLDRRSSGARIDASVVEPVRFSDLEYFSPKDKKFNGDYMIGIYDACKAGKTSPSVFVTDESVRRYARLLGKLKSDSSPTLDGPATFSKVAAGRYELSVPASAPTLFRIKLSYFPGMHLRDEHGRDLPLLEALPGMVGIGHGKMTLTYERTKPMRLGYVISIVALLGAFLAWARSRNATRDRSASSLQT